VEQLYKMKMQDSHMLLMFIKHHVDETRDKVSEQIHLLKDDVQVRCRKQEELLKSVLDILSAGASVPVSRLKFLRSRSMTVSTKLPSTASVPSKKQLQRAMSELSTNLPSTASATSKQQLLRACSIGSELGSPRSHFEDPLGAPHTDASTSEDEIGCQLDHARDNNHVVVSCMKSGTMNEKGSLLAAAATLDKGAPVAKCFEQASTSVQHPPPCTFLIDDLTRVPDCSAKVKDWVLAQMLPVTGMSPGCSSALPVSCDQEIAPGAVAQCRQGGQLAQHRVCHLSDHTIRM